RQCPADFDTHPALRRLADHFSHDRDWQFLVLRNHRVEIKRSRPRESDSSATSKLNSIADQVGAADVILTAAHVECNEGMVECRFVKRCQLEHFEDLHDDRQLVKRRWTDLDLATSADPLRRSPLSGQIDPAIDNAAELVSTGKIQLCISRQLRLA